MTDFRHHFVKVEGDKNNPPMGEYYSSTRCHVVIRKEDLEDFSNQLCYKAGYEECEE